MDNLITSKNLKTFFLSSFPKDIVNIIDNFLFEIIREEAKKLYDEVVDWMISPVLVPEEYFIKKFVPYFVKNVGWSFEDFLRICNDGHGHSIEYMLGIAIGRIEYFIFPTDALSDQDEADVEHYVSIFTKNVLNRMAYNEGYLKNNTIEDLVLFSKPTFK
jgi:hypothetical protein